VIPPGEPHPNKNAISTRCRLHDSEISGAEKLEITDMDSFVTRLGKPSATRHESDSSTKNSLSSAKRQLVLVNSGGGKPQCVVEVVLGELGNSSKTSAVVIPSAIMATTVVTGSESRLCTAPHP